VGKEESTDSVVAKVEVVRRKVVAVMGIQQHPNPSSWSYVKSSRAMYLKGAGVPVNEDKALMVIARLKNEIAGLKFEHRQSVPHKLTSEESE
jgi:hypothetical protein